MNLKEKLVAYNLDNLYLKKDIIDFFISTDAIFEEIERDYHQIDELLKIGKVNFSEFDALKKLINNFKKNFEHLYNLFSENIDKIENFRDLSDNSVGIIEEFKIVKDVYTSLTGDYVVDVEKDSLYSVNSVKLEFIVDTLKGMSLDSGEIEFNQELPNTCNLWLIMARLLSKFETEFLLNVVYRHPTELMRELIEITKSIDHQFNKYEKVIIRDYFELGIEKSLANIDILEVKYAEKEDKLIKLSHTISPKKNASSIFAFRDSLKYGFKFSK